MKMETRARNLILLVLLITLFVLSACTASPVQNDGDFNYRELSLIDTDPNYYHVTGVVDWLPVMNEFTGVEQMPYRFLGNDDENGAPVHVMRIILTKNAVGDSNGYIAARAESVVGVKVYGSMMNAMKVGDEITLNCRRQAEAVGAVAPQEKFDETRAIVYEFENCRPVEPTVNGPLAGR